MLTKPLFVFFVCTQSCPPTSHELSPLHPCRMTAVCPAENSPEGTAAGARAAGSKGSGPAGTAGSSSVSGAETGGESNGDSVGGSVGGTAVVTGGQRYSRWSRQDSSDINTDDEGATIRRLTPLERLNLDMCQDDRWGWGEETEILFLFLFPFPTCHAGKVFLLWLRSYWCNIFCNVVTGSSARWQWEEESASTKSEGRSVLEISPMSSWEFMPSPKVRSCMILMKWNYATRVQG